MDFRYTPEEAQSIALRLRPYLRRQRLSVEVEVPIASDAPFATTLLAAASGTVIAIECQHRPAYLAPLRELVGYLAVNRLDAEVSIATASDAELTASTLTALRSDGVGLMVLQSDDSVEVVLEARNPSLMITVNRTLSLGRCKAEIETIERKFNAGDRKGQLREMCELVERETGTLARRAAAKGWITKSVAEVDAMDFATRIDVLGSARLYTGGRSPLLGGTLKGDLHSFRGARNLVDHPARNRRADLLRQREFPERVLMGARLVADLLPLQRRVR